MFDFPQPGENYRSTGFPEVAVVGVLADGIPWDLPYRCPDVVWNPYRRKYTILIRLIIDGRIIDMPLSRFLREYTCVRPDLFKRNPENRYVVLKEITIDPVLQQWRAKNIDNYPAERPPVKQSLPLARQWRDIQKTGKELTPDNHYRHYL
ncbi:hypothetical protein [Serratia fonticola]|uniref:hypothetical protein n=1 Tax=Serratia fonticola TaxID=47917 RepID=UPI00137684D4|nr:hypothetical protein [Serratia fonticola]NCG52461.1 hypothetical protein [Serratia fonticola]